MKKTMAVLLAACMLLSVVLTGCFGAAPEETEEPFSLEATEMTEATEATEMTEETEADTTEAQASEAESLNLEELYQQGVDSLAALGDSAPILFPESNLDYLESFYPGISAIEMKQFCAGVAPVTNAPFEIILVEVADEADVQKVIDIFQARVDEASVDDVYPENAAAWLNEAKITSRGNYVFLAVLMNCEIPEVFILD